MINYQKHIRLHDNSLRTYKLSEDEIKRRYPPKKWGPDEIAEIEKYNRRYKSPLLTAGGRFKQQNWHIPKMREA